MPDFIATSPDGRKFKITAPEGATPDQMRAYAEANMAKLQPATQAAPQAPQQAPDGMLMSAAKGAGEGFARTALGAQQLVGKGLSAVGATGPGGWLEKDAQKGLDKEAASTAGDKQAHPWATEAGELFGGAVGPGGAASKVIKGTGYAAKIAQAGLSGAASGLLEPVEQAGSYWWNKAKQVGMGGATGAAAGAVLGTLATKVGNPAQKGVTSDAQELMKNGVKLTPGQMIGGLAKGQEEKATSFPMTGHFVQGALHEATKSFNIATINKALAPIGAKLPAKVAAGHDAVKAAQQAVSTAYDQVLSKMSLRADPTMVRGVEDIMKQAHAGALTKDLREDLQTYFDTRIKGVFQNKTLDGRQLKAVEEDLRTEEATWRKAAVGDPRRRQYADAIASMHAYIDDAIERQNPNYVADKRAADTTYAMLARIEGAASKRIQGQGIFTPGDLLGAIKAQESTVRKRAFAAGDSLMQGWADKAQTVIGNHTPDSGSPGRLMARDMWAVPMGVVLPMAAGLPYTKAGTATVRGVAQAAGAVGKAVAGVVPKPVGKAVAGAIPFAGAGAAQAVPGGND